MIDATIESIIHGTRPGRLTGEQRARSLVRRPWTRAERAVVLHGFFGRASLAIEPLICGLGFAAITAGVFAAPHFSRWVNSDIIIIAPVFGFGVLACIVWALGVMLAPLRALVHTTRPIYIVDGYIRYRTPDARSESGTNGYVAVLTDDGTIACEWPTIGDVSLPDRQRPAHCEFSEYGGVHAIDGVRTGVLPERIPRLGIGIAQRKKEIV